MRRAKNVLMAAGDVRFAVEEARKGGHENRTAQIDPNRLNSSTGRFAGKAESWRNRMGFFSAGLAAPLKHAIGGT